MSWSVFYQTKIVNLPDGRILHLDRSGCNNDTEGRVKEKFTGRIYTKDEFEDFIRKYEGGTVEIKIGSRSGKFKTHDDYAKHLRRMLKRATTWDELKEKASKAFKVQPHIEVLDKVVIFYKDGSEKEMTPKEFDDKFYDIIYGKDANGWRQYRHFEYEINEIIGTIENSRHKCGYFHIAA